MAVPSLDLLVLTMRTAGKWNMQGVLDPRFRRYKAQIGRNVTIRRAMVPVIGKDRQELEEIMCGVIYFLLTDPKVLAIAFLFCAVLTSGQMGKRGRLMEELHRRRYRLPGEGGQDVD